MKKQGKGKLETFEQTVNDLFNKNIINPHLFFFFFFFFFYREVIPYITAKHSNYKGQSLPKARFGRSSLRFWSLHRCFPIAYRNC